MVPPSCHSPPPHNVLFPPLPGRAKLVSPLHDDLHDDQQTMIGYRMGIYLSLSLFRLSLPLSL